MDKAEKKRLEKEAKEFAKQMKKEEKERAAEMKRLEKDRIALEKAFFKSKKSSSASKLESVTSGSDLPAKRNPVVSPAVVVAQEPPKKAKFSQVVEPLPTIKRLAMNTPDIPKNMFSRSSGQEGRTTESEQFENLGTLINQTADQEFNKIDAEGEDGKQSPSREESGRRSGSPTHRASPSKNSRVFARVSSQTDALPSEIVNDTEQAKSIGSMKSSDMFRNKEYLEGVIASFKLRMTSLYSNGTNRGYKEAFQALADVGRSQPTEVANRPVNKPKNRYANILPYDRTRVRLPIVSDDADTDYINANYIEGRGNPKAYIATQGPVPSSLTAFWRMVWFQQIEVIVMVTNEVEGDKLKCHRYWPDPTSSPSITKQAYGPIAVQYLSSTQHGFYTVRRFQVTLEQEGRTVLHFHYQGWPDHDVPLTTDQFLIFRNAVKSAVTRHDAPLCVHCSAGVGRTGTYIAVDQLVEEVLASGPLDVDKVVKQMRMGRMFMIQAEMQYVFVHRAVFDALSELVEDESSKVRRIEEQARAEIEYQRTLREAADRNAIEREMQAAALRKEYFARITTSVDNAKELVKGYGVKERVRDFKRNNDIMTLEYYKRLVDEWSMQNQVEADVYDTTAEWSPMQMIVEALRQKGMLG